MPRLKISFFKFYDIINLRILIIILIITILIIIKNNGIRIDATLFYILKYFRNIYIYFSKMKQGFLLNSSMVPF